MSDHELSRRGFISGTISVSLLAGARVESQGADSRDGAKFKLFWGDLHNHNELGLAKGSLQRSIDLARGHLDFFACTGHSHWHDMPKLPGTGNKMFRDGFARQAKLWPKSCQMIRDANTDDFVAMMGYEWHSSKFGDYCVIFPDDQAELFLPDHVEKLLDFAEAKGALAIPHHVGYKQGWRGANFDHFRPTASPVVEVFSEHGCTVSDRSPYPMIRHSMGGRSTSNTIARQLLKGRRFGFVASTDTHRGYPGAYGQGVAGVWARDLSAESLFEAMRARRTYAATGDRIALEVFVNGQPMGSELPATTDRQIDVRVEGQDAVERVELVRNGRVIERYYPADHVEGPPKLPGRAKCRIQYGWGPWAQFDLGRICLWDAVIRIEGGRFWQVIPCFQVAPFDEQLRDKLTIVSENEIHLQSNTTRVKCYGEDPTKAIVCCLEGKPDSILSVQLRKPTEKTVRARLRDLTEDNVVTFTGPFTTESYVISRLASPREYSAAIRWHDRRSATDRPDWYYVRVTQYNGQYAWSSPIWVG